METESPAKVCEKCVRFSGCYPVEYGGARYYNTRLVAGICKINHETENILYGKVQKKTCSD